MRRRHHSRISSNNIAEYSHFILLAIGDLMTERAHDEMQLVWRREGKSQGNRNNVNLIDRRKNTGRVRDCYSDSTKEKTIH